MQSLVKKVADFVESCDALSGHRFHRAPKYHLYTHTDAVDTWPLWFVNEVLVISLRPLRFFLTVIRTPLTPRASAHCPESLMGPLSPLVCTFSAFYHSETLSSNLWPPAGVTRSFHWSCYSQVCWMRGIAFHRAGYAVMKYLLFWHLDATFLTCGRRKGKMQIQRDKLSLLPPALELILRAKIKYKLWGGFFWLGSENR